MNGFDYLGLKAELLVEGIQATEEALKEVGKRHKEQNHGLFGWDFEDHVGRVLPDDFVLPADEIKRYYDTGIRAIGFSMEIWDEKLYQGICPGKSKEVTHADFLDSIRMAVSIFGEGNVYGIFVMGLEPKKTFLEGVRQITGLGANVVPFVWSPNPGSRLEGYRAPTGQWFVDTILEASEIVYNSRVPSGTENHCYRCDGNSLLHDALRLRGIQ